MPITETVLRVFVSSPGDVSAEREVIVATIAELNNTWSSHLGLRLEPILWETHCRPGAGDDAQQVINKQIPSDYEIFVGIMWQRFGTPTPRFGSGSEEEFENAHLRHKKHPKKVSVLFYFKDNPVPPSEVDINQLKRVNCFRNRIGPKGIFYWYFKSSEEFRQLVRIHLSREMQQWIEQARRPKSSVKRRGVPNVSLRLKQLCTRAEQQTTILCHVITQLRMISKNALIEGEKAKAKTAKAKTTQEFDQGVKGFIEALNTYSSKSKSVTEDFADLIDDTVEAWIDCFTAALLIGFATPKEINEILSVIRALTKLLAQASKKLHKINPFPESLLKWPHLHSAYRKTAKINESFGNELDTAVKILREAERVFGVLVTRKSRVKGKLTRN